MASLKETESRNLSKYPDTTDMESRISDEQEAQKADKYVQVKPTVDGDVVKEVHEYVTPRGDIGYQAFAKCTVGGVDYFKSFGSGAEALDRGHDWREFKSI